MYTAKRLLQWRKKVDYSAVHYVDQRPEALDISSVCVTTRRSGLVVKLLSQSSLICLSLYMSVQANEFPDDGGTTVIDLGTPLPAEQLESLSQHVFADGTGLPEGSGSAVQGAVLYATHCASCHGSEGQGGKALELVGDRSLLATDYPDKGIAVYWPNAPTLHEYIRRSMPPETPGMFSNNELYALVAHLLELNDLIEPDVVLDRQSLSAVQMPNRQGFTTIAR